ncbi:MAG TPA: hypothetical protein PK512_07300, partial [bacterium]|nr:hypothetical protein [bacterium]
MFQIDDLKAADKPIPQSIRGIDLVSVSVIPYILPKAETIILLKIMSGLTPEIRYIARTPGTITEKETHIFFDILYP